jgi:hypothetical protein
MIGVLRSIDESGISKPTETKIFLESSRFRVLTNTYPWAIGEPGLVNILSSRIRAYDHTTWINGLTFPHGRLVREPKCRTRFKIT